MTEEERKEAERLASKLLDQWNDETGFLVKNTSYYAEVKDLMCEMYAAACEAKRRELVVKEEANQRLADKINGGLGKDIQATMDLYLNERARSAKLLLFAKWIEMRLHGFGISDDAAKVVDEYEAVRG